MYPTTITKRKPQSGTPHKVRLAQILKREKRVTLKFQPTTRKKSN